MTVSTEPNHLKNFMVIKKKLYEGNKGEKNGDWKEQIGRRRQPINKVKGGGKKRGSNKLIRKTR